MLILSDEIIDLLWQASFILAYISFLILVILVILRSHKDNKQKQRLIRKKELEKLIITYIESPFKTPNLNLVKNKNDLLIISEIVEEMLRSLKGDVKQNILVFLKNSGAYDILLNKLRYKNSEGKIIAIKLLENWNDKETYELMVNTLNNTNRNIRIAAMQGLSSMNEPSSFSGLLMHIQEKIKDYSVPILFDIFIKFGKSIIEDLEKIILDEKTNYKIKVAALKTLGTFEDLKSVDSIISIGRSTKNFAINEAVYEALYHIGLAVPKDIIEKGLKSENFKVRIYTIRLAQNYGVEFLSTLKSMLDDQNFDVARKSAEAIFTLNKELLAIISSANSTAGKRASAVMKELTN
ncbi:MAG TPA: HEAT repeat domain-containing protein [Rickettsiales bacterium]|nr:HEAT repeat domain-containing protein [Rickettsiales bacterium]